MLTREFRAHALDRAFDAERLAATDTEEWLFPFEDARRGGDGAKVELRHEVMTFSGQVALQRPHCTQASSVKRSSGRSGSSPSAPVGQAATQARQSVQPSNVDFDRAEGGARRQGDNIDWRRRRAMQLAQRQHQHFALLSDRHKARGPR